MGVRRGAGVEGGGGVVPTAGGGGGGTASGSWRRGTHLL